MKRIPFYGWIILANMLVFLILSAQSLWPLHSTAAADTLRNDAVTRVAEAQKNQLTVETMNTVELRAKGLTGHAPLTINQGMLFVFEKPAIQCMWNKDVDFAVGVIFLNKNGTGINGAIMPAHSETPVCSKQKVMHVIEMNPERIKGVNYARS